ncbi:MAG: hypothetical protein R6V05_13180 [Candidatus Brocadiia bacterium]
MQRNNIYIKPRMTGCDAKVSLHESGTGMYALTTNWPGGFGGADSQMRTWAFAQPNGRSSVHVLRVIIPASELRPLRPQEDLGAVTWLEAPPAGEAALVDCFLTPPVSSCPGADSCPYDQLASLQLRDHRWFLAMSHTDAVSKRTSRAIAEAREQAKAAARAKKLRPNPAYRAALFVDGAGEAKGLIEMALFSGAARQQGA